jgi:hypothetical protein
LVGLVEIRRDLGEEVTTEKLVGILVDMKDGIAVGDGPGLQYSVVTAGT